MIQKIDGNTRLCGLIGYPVKHTMSPVIHNYLAGCMGNNLVYVPFEVADNIAAAVKGAYELNVLGMNVTVPYKKNVMEVLAAVDENAARIGAVNTLVRVEGGYKGYNTDYLGLKRAMAEENIPVEGQDVVILGAGGAANAVVYMCAQAGAKNIYLLNRTFKTAQQLADRIHGYFPQTVITAMEMTDYGQLPDVPLIAIQTTSVGLAPDCGRVVIEDGSFYEKITKAVDIIYNPSETMFMKKVREHGGYACNGLKMLLYQGVTAYEMWNNMEVDETVCRKIYERLEEEMGIGGGQA